LNPSGLIRNSYVYFNNFPKKGYGMLPKFTSVKGWTEISGMGRTNTFAALGRGDLRAVKQGGKTLIDVDAGLAWLNSLPRAEYRQPAAKGAA
jgi:hypothetical protein